MLGAGRRREGRGWPRRFATACAPPFPSPRPPPLPLPFPLPSPFPSSTSSGSRSSGSSSSYASDLIEAEEDEDPEDREPEDVDEGNGDGNGNGSGNGGGRGEGKGGAQAVANRRGQPRPSRRRPAPNIADELKRGQTKLVQVIKEAIGTKGPRVTAQVSLAGRFLVYMPFASKVGVSRKIEARDQRAKLREMVTKLVPADSGGWIIRTVADDLTEASCKREIDHLLSLWKKIKRKQASGRAPALLQRETSLTRGIVRDLLSDKVDLLLVDSKLLYNEIEQYLTQIGRASCRERV